MNSSISQQRRYLPPLSALRAFEAAARHQSFRLAANELSVTPTAISHQVRQLESLLGVPLFERRVRKVLLTAQGRTLYPVLRDGFDAFAAVMAPLLQPKKRRTLTISATPAFVARRLVPKVADFHAQHGDLDLRLHASTTPVDFSTQQIDAAIRYGRGDYPGLQSEYLSSTQYAPLCSPRLGLHTTTQLPRHPLLHYLWQPSLPDPPDWPAWGRKAGLGTMDFLGGVTFSDETHAMAAAIAGQGVALLNTSLVADELAQGTLVQPFGPTLDGFAYYLVYPPATASDPAFHALRAWLRDALSAAPA
ncbi:LysR substrate-binding domain-containing protein [Dyella tabacisoli]|uniref:LysR substrate-binding domain-containing protein n=1 Tax=Dyella tabacisoli TaxID=2282381 RepID=UPI00361B29EB